MGPKSKTANSSMLDKAVDMKNNSATSEEIR